VQTECHENRLSTNVKMGQPATSHFHSLIVPPAHLDSRVPGGLRGRRRLRACPTLPKTS
jgi:hypothetical protein